MKTIDVAELLKPERTLFPRLLEYWAAEIGTPSSFKIPITSRETLADYKLIVADGCHAYLGADDQPIPYYVDFDKPVRKPFLLPQSPPPPPRYFHFYAPYHALADKAKTWRVFSQGQDAWPSYSKRGEAILYSIGKHGLLYPLILNTSVLPPFIKTFYLVSQPVARIAKVRQGRLATDVTVYRYTRFEAFKPTKLERVQRPTRPAQIR